MSRQAEDGITLIRLVRSSVPVLVALAWAACSAAPSTRAGPPRARASDFEETLHGAVIRDPYRWLETSSDEQRAYLAAHDAYARGVLDRIEGREALRKEVAEDPDHQPTAYMQGVAGRPPRLFYVRQLGDGGHSLVVREGWGGRERVLLDVGRRETADATWTVETAYPSDDGEHVLASLQRNGSERPHLELVDVDRGTSAPAGVEASNEAQITWHPDGRSFFYSRPGGDVYQHALDGGADRLVFGASVPGLGTSKEAYAGVYPAAGSRWLTAMAHPGTSGSPEVFVAPLAEGSAGPRPWRRIATAADRVLAAAVHGDRAYAVVHGTDERERILAIDLARGTAADARQIVGPGDDQIEDVCAASDALYLRLRRGGTGLRRIGFDGETLEDVPLPMKGIVSYVWCDPDAPEVVFGVYGRVHEAFRYAPGEPIARAGLYRPPPDKSGVVTERVEARSADGAMVPLRIVSPRGLVRDGRAPALLSGYAAYGNAALDIDGSDSPWSRRGGVYAVCGARGGGDKGEAWHKDGQKLKKENGVDDFLACARYLVEHRYTAPSRLTAIAGSAGGVLVGGAITKQPELFAAAILVAPIVNLVRLSATPIGPANVAEFGDPDVPEELAAMLRSDPLHRIRDGVRYPAVLLRSGAGDSRVPPWQAAKLAARLLAASASGRPVLLQVPKRQGHLSVPRREEIENDVDEYAFALWQSGLLRGPDRRE